MCITVIKSLSCVSCARARVRPETCFIYLFGVAHHIEPQLIKFRAQCYSTFVHLIEKSVTIFISSTDLVRARELSQDAHLDRVFFLIFQVLWNWKVHCASGTSKADGAPTKCKAKASSCGMRAYTWMQSGKFVSAARAIPQLSYKTNVLV